MKTRIELVKEYINSNSGLHYEEWLEKKYLELLKEYQELREDWLKMISPD